MNFTKRRSLLVLIDVAMLFQIVSFAVMFYFHEHSTSDWLKFNVIPFEAYAIVNVLLLIASICLYCGIFRVSNVFTIIGLLILLFLLHVLFAIVLIIYIDGSESTKQLRRHVRAKPIFPNATHRTALFPGLWICVWAFVLMRMIFFFMKMQEFKKHPPFVRQSMHLIRAMSSLAALRSTAV